MKKLAGVGSTGLYDGPYLPGKAPRKKPAPKTPEELAAIRAKAWETRRSKTGGTSTKGNPETVFSDLSVALALKDRLNAIRKDLVRLHDEFDFTEKELQKHCPHPENERQHNKYFSFCGICRKAYKEGGWS